MSLAVVLTLGLGLVSPGMTQDARQTLASFQGEFEPLLALTVVYGVGETWNEQHTSRLNHFTIRGDYVEPLYDVGYVEDGVDKHVVIGALTPQPRHQYNCHSCSPMLGGAVFRRDGDVWRVESTGLKIEAGHAWFDGKHGRLTLVRVGPNKYGLLHEVLDIGQGHEWRKASLIFGVNGVLASRLVVPPVAGPGPGACGVPAQHLKVDILEAGAGVNNPTDSGSGFFEVVVDALWNEARCESVEGGTSSRSSGRACQRTSRYRYREGMYVQADVGNDVCMRLPEQTVDLRG